MRIVSPTFYALGRSRTPVMVSMASVVVNVALNLALVRVMGYRGLALGTSVTALVNAGAQLLLLRRLLDGVELPTVARTFARVAVATAAMGVVAWGSDHLLTDWWPGAPCGSRW